MGEQIGVGARDVDVDVRTQVEAVHDPRKIPAKLNLVDEDIGHPPLGKTLLDVGMQCRRLAEWLEVQVFQIDSDDPLLGNALLPEPFGVHFQQNGLPAAADSRDDLDDLLVAPCAQALQVLFSLYSHGILLNCLSVF